MYDYYCTVVNDLYFFFAVQVLFIYSNVSFPNHDVEIRGVQHPPFNPEMINSRPFPGQPQPVYNHENELPPQLSVAGISLVYQSFYIICDNVATDVFVL